MAKSAETDESLKRLGGGRWQTRDERFTIEPQSGTWVVVDAERTDDLGLALVRGPFGSLGAAKEAIATARDSEPEASPLAARVKELGERPAGRAAKPGKATRSSGSAEATEPESRGKSDAAAKASRPKPRTAAKPEPDPEPRWIVALEPADRRRARRLIDRLSEAGAADAEGIARRDIVGDVPAVAEFAIARALVGLGADASAAKVASLLAGGRDEDLDVRWRLVDDDGRPITIDVDVGKGRRT